MKNLIITILSLIIITACGPKTVNEYGLNRNVESCTVKAYEVVSKFGEYTKGEIATIQNIVNKQAHSILFIFRIVTLIHSISPLA